MTPFQDQGPRAPSSTTTPHRTLPSQWLRTVCTWLTPAGSTWCVSHRRTQCSPCLHPSLTHTGWHHRRHTHPALWHPQCLGERMLYAGAKGSHCYGHRSVPSWLVVSHCRPPATRTGTPPPNTVFPLQGWGNRWHHPPATVGGGPGVFARHWAWSGSLLECA